MLVKEWRTAPFFKFKTGRYLLRLHAACHREVKTGSELRAFTKRTSLQPSMLVCQSSSCLSVLFLLSFLLPARGLSEQWGWPTKLKQSDVVCWPTSRISTLSL